MEAFQLRLWDGRIGRWLSPDPYGQYASPYLGMGNNPVNRIDPDGGMDEDPGKGFPSILNNYQPQYGPENSTIAYQINLSGLTVINNYHKPSSNFNIDGGFSGRAFPTINGGDNMSTSVKGINFILSYEKGPSGNGPGLFPYDAKDGGLTIGYGHFIKKEEKGKFDAGITRKQADELFAIDLRVRENTINRLVKVRLSQNQFDAISSYYFNTGSLKNTKLLHYLNHGNFIKAAAEMDIITSNGVIMKGLIRRRTEEQNIFLTGIYK